MKLFKKKKSEKNLANAILLQDSRELESSHVAKYHTKPASSMATIPVASTSTTLPNTPTIEERPPSPPLILMPKPRRPHTPTRALMGRYDHDKTQVEEDESSPFVHQQEISPILLPTPRELPLLPQLVKPAARHLPQQQAPGAVSSHSTIISDDSSRVYESALESLSDATEDDPTAAAERPVLPAVVKKKPSLKPIVNPLHMPLLPQQQLQQDIMAIGVISDSSSSLTASPQQQQQHIQKRSNAGSSANNVTPLQHDSKQTSTPKMASKSEQKKPQNQHVPPPQPAQRLLLDSLFEQQKEDGQAALLIEQQKKDEQTALLKELKRQVELIEKQRIKDREEWTRKEQELLSHRHQMMETLIETKEQLTSVLKSREEDHNNKAKLTYYDQQLKQQQLLQLQKQVAEMNLKHHHHHHHQQQQQQQQEEGDDDEEEIDEEDLNANYYPQQFYPENDPDALLEKDDMGYDEAQMYHHRRMRNRSKSEDHIKHHSRSASRSSHHYQHADDGRRSSNSRSNYNGDDIPAPRKPVSRRASNASSKSTGGHRLDHTSPATTLVSSHSASKRRPRARSIESARWHEEQQMMMQMNGLPVYMDEMMVPYEKIRRSRSAGRDLHSMRPVSRASSAYNNPYYDDGDRVDEELFDSHPTFYDNEYYSGHMDNIPPKQQQQQQQQQMMPRYSHDIPYYPMPPQPHLSHQYLYSPADYYYQPPRHGQRYSSRHHYSYN
ncbi:hypothetical protein [Parasitella parasitica]|uniref:Uncharacterized protein n=1 Tax=Parasitella parasitica TaxID=35722 RepID=A0A0B7N5A9_9FUNG|nr:hypothetical protein [Parasitella parasitica]